MGILESIDPSTGQILARYEAMAWPEIERILESSVRAFTQWRQESLSARAQLLNQAAAVLRRQPEELARLMAREMGKPIAQGRAEVEKCAWNCEFFAARAACFLAPEFVATEATRSYVTFQPLGLILAVMPWNFPFWQVFRFAAPALMAGNAAVLKHASNVSGCALAIERIFRDAGFPPDLFRTVLTGSANVAPILRHPAVQAVTLTGSTPAGRAVASLAGSLLKKSVLELGGSDPYVVLADADIEATAATCATARLMNNGQSCIAAKRFIVVDSVRPAFEEKLVQHLRQAKVGDPLDETTQVGPLARHDLRQELHDQVCRSLAAGAKLRLGGEIPPGPGNFYPPTVLSGVRRGQPAFDEELFGPVAAIVPVPDETAAIRAANDSVFGLGAAVFTRDTARGERIAAEQIESGSCFVNSFVKSDPRLPFGGIKESGYGRELASYGLREFVNIKTVYVK